jgi:spore maturation protein CgeB
VDGIEAWFEPGREVVVAEAGEPLCDAIRSLLREPTRARRVAEAAHRRTWAEHTWERRIDGILAALGV